DRVVVAMGAAESENPARLASSPGRSGSVYFSSSQRTAIEHPSVFLRDDKIVSTIAQDRREVELISRHDITLPGMHNVENVMAALAATLCALGPNSVDMERLRETIKAFKGVEHRIEFVETIKGVKYYNDSKATNVDSTVKSLEAFSGNIILILGGKDKGSDYAQLAHLVSERVKQIVLIGAASDKIASQLYGIKPIVRAGSMADAIAQSTRAAVSGDIVLLAPACASFDMFDNYEHRGRAFKDEVRKLARSSNRAAGEVFGQ
ncbi:MAG: glutamate ligase domain-containing protein, partial [Blastocatellia bacterium]